MKRPTLITVIDLAISGGILKLKTMQEQIILQDNFKGNAVIHPTFYDPGKIAKNADLFKDLRNEHDDLLSLLSWLHDAREKYYDKIFEMDLYDFLNSKG